MFGIDEIKFVKVVLPFIEELHQKHPIDHFGYFYNQELLDRWYKQLKLGNVNFKFVNRELTEHTLQHALWSFDRSNVLISLQKRDIDLGRID